MLKMSTSTISTNNSDQEDDLMLNSDGDSSCSSGSEYENIEKTDDEDEEYETDNDSGSDLEVLEPVTPVKRVEKMVSTSGTEFKSGSKRYSNNKRQNGSNKKPKKREYEQKFRPAWCIIAEFKDWLCVDKDNSDRAYCKFCSMPITAKKNVIKSHSESANHVKNSNPKSTQRTLEKSANSMETFVGLKPRDDDVRVIEARLALYIAEHSSILPVDHLTDVVKKSCGPKSTANAIQLKRTKCTAIIKNAWQPYFIKKLLEDIGSNSFSLILDESTDISTHKMLGVVIRYISIESNEVISTFLSMVQLIDGTANSIVNALDDLLTKFGINKKNCVGIGTDNASVMVGINNGVHKKLEEMWGIKIVLMRCVCHSIQLAVSSACDELPTCLDFILKETYNWFSNSTNRQNEYEILYKQFYDDEPLKIIQLSATRWLSRYFAIERICSHYEVLRSYFNSIRQKEKNYTVSLLAEMYNDDNNYVYLLYLKHLLYDVNRTNKLFESNKNPLKLVDDLVNLVETLGKNIISTNLRHRVNIFETDNFDSHMDPVFTLGFSCEEKLKLIKKRYKDSNEERKGEEIVHNIRIRCRAFTLSLLKELKNRIPDNYKILRMLKELSVENSVSQIKERITDLINLPELRANLNDEDIDRIEKQWDNLTFVKWDKDVLKSKDPVRFWNLVSKYEDASGENPFRDLSQFVNRLLSLPLSNAEVERVFSVLTIIKDKKRNRMKLQLANALIRIRFSLKRMNTKCCEIDVPPEVCTLIGKGEIYSEMSDEAGNYADADEDELFEYFIRF